MHPYFGTIPRLRWQDVLDILIVAFVIYRIGLLIRGTRAVQMVVGLLILGVVYITSQILGLFTLNWLLNSFLGSLILILVVIFQTDIRRALIRVGSGQFFQFFGLRTSGEAIAEQLTQAATWLSAHRIGGLIALEQEVGLNEYIEAGRRIDGQVSAELLETIFMPGSPLHDGAVIVKGPQVLAAACLLPLSASPNVSRALGTRHRAAIGLTEESDAVVIVVSEQDGTISLAQGGSLSRGLEPSALRATLQKLHAA
ncbi:MAG TPA: diadenylate cyclase CdaA [Candidatus Binataceae bacterium]|nr:diadenylate cyclase CdaA [Candidatus Binataceae bacterium]